MKMTVSLKIRELEQKCGHFCLFQSFFLLKYVMDSYRKLKSTKNKEIHNNFQPIFQKQGLGLIYECSTEEIYRNLAFMFSPYGTLLLIISDFAEKFCLLLFHQDFGQ